jgi:hypothetical protein
MNMTTTYGYRTECIDLGEFPPFVRMRLKDTVRKELFLCAVKKVETIKREYKMSENVLDKLYGKKKSKILRLLSKNPQPARTLIETSGLSPSEVYHFLNKLRKRHTVSKKGHTYYLEDDFTSLFLDEIVKLEEDPALRRKYGISIGDLELAHFLWNTLVMLTPQEKQYARTYRSTYTLADAVHRWKVGRTDIPVWALHQLEELTGSDIIQVEGVTQYHLPPGTPVKPYYKGEYKLPVEVNSDLDKVVIQLFHKMSKNHVYAFPKKREWLFEKLHNRFGEFCDSTFRIPSAIVEILKGYYRIETFNRSSTCIPPRIKVRWSGLNPLLRIAEASSLLLHVISLSSQSNSGTEITSRSKSFLQEISTFAFDTGLGELRFGKKCHRPHFRVYLSESKAAVLRRYAHLFQVYPDLETWLRIPLNQITKKLILTTADLESVEQICYGELSRFVELILRFLERRTSHEKDYLQFKEEITDYFWERKVIPSPRRVEELVKMYVDEKENIVYVGGS